MRTANVGSDLISLIGATGEILYASPSTENTLGFSPDEFVGRAAVELVHPKDAHQSRRILKKALITPAVAHPLTIRIRSKHGEWRWVAGSIFNCLAEPRIGAFVLNCRPIGAVEPEQNRVGTRLRAATRKAEWLEDYVKGIGRDFTEPLRTISIFTDILIRNAKFDSEEKLLVQRVLHGIEDLSRLSDAINEFVGGGGEDRSDYPVDLEHVMVEVSLDVYQTIPNTTALVTWDTLPWVTGQEPQLYRIFRHLIKSAVRNPNGVPTPAHVSAEIVGTHFLIKVRSEAAVIPAAYNRLASGTLKDPRGSEVSAASLDLAVSKRIIEDLGGIMWIESGGDNRSIICFTLLGVQQGTLSSLAAERLPR